MPEQVVEEDQALLFLAKGLRLLLGEAVLGGDVPDQDAPDGADAGHEQEQRHPVHEGATLNQENRENEPTEDDDALDGPAQHIRIVPRRQFAPLHREPGRHVGDPRDRHHDRVEGSDVGQGVVDDGQGDDEHANAADGPSREAVGVGLESKAPIPAAASLYRARVRHLSASLPSVTLGTWVALAIPVEIVEPATVGRGRRPATVRSQAAHFQP